MRKNTKAPEGTTTGATAGGVIGGTLGLLAGIGALAIPAGPSHRGRSHHGCAGRTRRGWRSGWTIGALVGMGMPEYEAKRYEGRVKAGGVLLSVHCDTSDEISRAKDLLKADRRRGHRILGREERQFTWSKQRTRRNSAIVFGPSSNLRGCGNAAPEPFLPSESCP